MSKSNQQKISPERLIRERGRSLEIHECLMDKKCLEQYGETTVIVARKHKGDKYTMCSYLLDAYCLGVKDTFYRVRMDEYEYKEIVSRFNDTLSSYDGGVFSYYLSICYIYEQIERIVWIIGNIQDSRP